MVHLRVERITGSKKVDLESEEDQALSRIRVVFLDFLWSAWDQLPYHLDIVNVMNVKKQCLGSSYWDVCILFTQQIHLFLFNGIECVDYINNFENRCKLLTEQSKLLNIISISCV